MVQSARVSPQVLGGVWQRVAVRGFDGFDYLTGAEIGDGEKALYAELVARFGQDCRDGKPGLKQRVVTVWRGPDGGVRFGSRSADALGRAAGMRVWELVTGCLRHRLDRWEHSEAGWARLGAAA